MFRERYGYTGRAWTAAVFKAAFALSWRSLYTKVELSPVSSF
jgi:hypothetical protein